jgi:hypothetical protein
MTSTRELELFMERDLAGLIALIHQHLAEEEAHLDATLRALQQTRAALLGTNTPVLGEVLARQEELAHVGAELRRKREQFRRQAAGALGVEAESITLNTLAAWLPDEGGAQLAQARQRLLQKMAEVGRLRQSSAVLIHSYLGLVDQVLLQATGGRVDGGRYGPAGTQQTPTYGPIVEARG